MSENQPILSTDRPTPPTPEDITRALLAEEKALDASRDRLLDARVERSKSNLSRTAFRFLGFRDDDSASSSDAKVSPGHDDQSSQNMS